jgi:hypothetical protein
MGKLVLTPHRLAFALYIILIAVHVALVIVWSKHYERRLVINDDSETLARLQRQAITVLVPQLFAIVSSFLSQTIAPYPDILLVALPRSCPHSFTTASSITGQLTSKHLDIALRSTIRMERIRCSFNRHPRSIPASHGVSPNYLYRSILGGFHGTTRLHTCLILCRCLRYGHAGCRIHANFHWSPPHYAINGGKVSTLRICS